VFIGLLAGHLDESQKHLHWQDGHSLLKSLIFLIQAAITLPIS
jgi:hypothetical protein